MHAQLQALVNQELFDRVQVILDASGVAGERRRVHDHYLKGSVWCDRCDERGRRGWLILAKARNRHGTGYFYFLCRGRQDGHCDLPYLPVEDVEDAVVRHWAAQQLPEDFITSVRARVRMTMDETTASARLLHDQLTAELAKIDRQEENLLDLAAHATLATARATRSANDALTLIAQEVIKPFDGQGNTRELHLHDLPWPGDVLADLGAATVTLRITLSYFIEPNPANRGWRDRYRYQSHGLRFDLRRATETNDEFRKRLNAKALDEDEKRPASAASDAKEWTFGPSAHGSGSIHTDLWSGSAADLARRGMLAVYPVTGWWKEIKSRDRSHLGARYALILSIETPGQDVDIWTPVAAQVGIPIDVAT